MTDIHKMSADELLDEVILAINEGGYYEVRFREHWKTSIDFDHNNKHLSNPFNEDIYYITSEREVPLTGSELVYGDYLLFTYGGHDDVAFVDSCDSLDELEEEMLNGANLGNLFTNYIVPIVHGKYKEYKYDECSGDFEWVSK